jgi:hypothetical protein
MTRLLKVFRAGKLSDLRSPRVRTGGAWRNAHTVYRKEGGAWVEWWPLKPDPPTNLESFFVFRNKRMELDINWDEATGPRPPADAYDIQVDVAAGRGREAYTYRNTVSPTFLNPDLEWDYRSGLMTITVWGVYSHSGVRSEPVKLGPLPILRPPQPPPPVVSTSSVTVYRVNQFNSTPEVGRDVRGVLGDDGYTGAVLNFEIDPSIRVSDHSMTVKSTALSTSPVIKYVGGNKYEVDITKHVVSTHIGNSYKDLTKADPQFGSPGGTLGIVIRLEEGERRSVWVPLEIDIQQTTSYYQPATPAFVPPPGMLIPGTSRIVGQQFKDGLLEASFETPFASTAELWWQKEGEPLVPLPDQTPGGSLYSGKVVVADSANWVRDGVTRYRIAVRGVTVAGLETLIEAGPWAVKLPNPYYLEPTGSAELRNGIPDLAHSGEYIRQGTSNDLGTTTKWTGLLFYNQNELSERRVGYTVNVATVKVMVRRHENSTPRYGVPPVVRTHGYDSPSRASTNLSGDLYSAGRFVSQTPGEYRLQELAVKTAADILNPNVPSVNGIAVRNGLRGSEALMVYHGPNHKIEGRKAWTIQITHDG